MRKKFNENVMLINIISISLLSLFLLFIDKANSVELLPFPDAQIESFNENSPYYVEFANKIYSLNCAQLRKLHAEFVKLLNNSTSDKHIKHYSIIIKVICNVKAKKGCK